MEDKEITLRFLLRTVYRKGIMDSNEKKCDMSWEDTIIKDIKKLYETTNGKIQERNNEKGKNIKGKLERIKEWLFCQ